MAAVDDGEKIDTSNEITDADTGGGGVCRSIEIDGDSQTIYSVLREFVTDVVSPPPPPLLKRIKSSAAKAAPRLGKASRNSLRDLCLWTRRGGTFRAIFVISVGTMTLLAVTGLLIFMCFFIAATLNAIIVSLLVSLAAVGGFLAIFFACLTAVYIGALSFAIFIIATTTISALIAVIVVTGWIGFFWIVWLAAKKSLDLTRQSIRMTTSAVAGYSTAWQAKQGALS